MSDLGIVRKEVQKIVETVPGGKQYSELTRLKNKYPKIGETELLKLLSQARHGNIAILLDDVQEFYRKYVVFQSESQSDTVALWTAATHIFQQFDQSPYLNIASPEKRCGKSRVLEVAELFGARPWRVVGPTEGVLFRKIQRDQPTLLFDEIDTVFRSRRDDFEGIRALLNAGNRAGTTVPRCVGANFEIRDFAVYCPKAFAGIGDKLPATVKDRSITINLARKKQGEKVSRFRQREAAQAAEPLKARLGKWAQTADLSQARPEMPEGLNDRAEDCWEPLLAIADLAGGDWPERARRAARELSIGCDESESVGTRLLQDIQDLFDDKEAERLSSEELIKALVELEEAPWGDYYGRQLTTRSMARLLKPFGIKPKTHRFGEETVRGYLRADFVDSFARYLPPKPSVSSKQPLKTQQAQHGSSDLKLEAQQENFAEAKKQAATRDVAVLHFETHPKGNREKTSRNKESQFLCSRCGRKAGTRDDPLFSNPVADGHVCRECWDELSKQAEKNLPPQEKF